GSRQMVRKSRPGSGGGGLLSLGAERLRGHAGVERSSATAAGPGRCGSTLRQRSGWSERMKRQAALLLGLFGALASGCGYTSGELYRPGIETVHVEIFES